jgi:phage terminase large subunit-like protein
MTRLRRLSLAEAREEGIGYYFSQQHADHAVEFIEKHLVHSKGRWAGQNFKLLDWQRVEVIEELFGWLRVEDNLRRYRVGYITTPKKNGKSTLLAGIGLYLLVADQEAGAEVYGCGVDGNVASIVFREAASMVRASPLLARRLEIIDSRKTIANVARSSFYKVLAGDAFRAEGLNIHGLLFDELHAQRDRRLWDSLRYGGASRSQPLLLTITTAGFDRNSICYEQYSYAKKVRADWTIDPTFYYFLNEAEEDDDWTSPAVWAKANASWGITINPEDFAQEFKEAELSNTKENSFRRYRLNQWTQQEMRWLKIEDWQACAVAPRNLLDGRECYCGLDLAATTDTTAFVAVFPDEDGTYDVLCRFWIPQENAERRSRRDKVPYEVWASNPATGLTMTPGNVCDFDVVRRDINEFASRYNVRCIGLDRWGATQLATQLAGDGIELVGYAQSFAAMSGPSKLLENLVISRKIRHSGNPVLSWMAGNVSVSTNSNGDIKPTKPKPNSAERIDGIVSLVMALGVQSKATIVQQKAAPGVIVL